MRTTKKILSMILAFVLVLGLIPATAIAAEGEYVYLSISFDGKYIDDKNGDTIVYLPISLDKIAAVDLAEYVLYIRSYVAQVVGRRAEILVDGQEQVVLEHTLDDILRGARHVEILLAALNLGKHDLVDIEELIDNLHLLARLLVIPLLELGEQRLVDVVGPVIDLENLLASIILRAACAEKHGRSK